MENEGNVMRTLNNFKNRMIQKCDYAFSCMVKEDELDQELFVQEVRQTFFQMLKPYLKELPNFFKGTDAIQSLTEDQKVFHNYFDKNSYIDDFDDPKEKEFAKALLTSSQLQCFCDDFFNETEVNNFYIFYKIINKPVGQISNSKWNKPI